MWIEAVGAAGVIASLLFVGVQVKQSAEAVRAATVLDLKENWAQLNLTYLEVPEMTDAYLLVAEVGYANADPRSQFLFASAYRAIMHNWSNAYYQYRLGTLDDEQWRPVLRDMVSDSRTANVQAVWDDWAHIFDDPFRSLMDSLRAEMR